MRQMSTHTAYAPQRGIALFVSLLLLFIMTIVAVSAMGSVNLQEKMSGNSRIQTKAFEAASAGVSRAIDFANDSDNWIEDDGTSHDTCETGDDWVGKWGDWQALGSEGAAYRLRIYCIYNKQLADEGGYEENDIPMPPQLFVLSEGALRAPGKNGDILARRQIEVRVGKIDDTRRESAMRFEGDADIKIENWPSSNHFSIDGNGGPAVSTALDSNTDKIISEIGANRIDNYAGGVSTTDYGPPWNDPNNLLGFSENIKGIAQDKNNQTVCPSNSPVSYVNGNKGSLDGHAGLTYVTGDLDVSGNDSGSGIIVVRGGITLSGTPSFDGLIIGLGENFTANGLGNGEYNGSMFFANLVEDTGACKGSPPCFGEKTVKMNGGGTNKNNPAKITYSCEELAKQKDLLSCLDPDLADQWNLSCDSSGVKVALTVQSWRENTGWREELFDPE